VSHVTRTCRAHQVAAAALYQLQQKAYLYSRDMENSDSGQIKADGFRKWCAERSEMYPQFHFWQTVLDFELTIFQFVRSQQVSNFDLYVASQADLVTWFFALDHSNYACWLLVHVQVMSSLQERCPYVFREFICQAFNAKKTLQPFSAISLDQAHEQINALVKGKGRAVNLTENPGALRRWMAARLEIARLVAEFEEGFDENETTSDVTPPYLTMSRQKVSRRNLFMIHNHW